MDHNKSMNRQRQRRRFRVRKTIRGSAERPRLTVFRSNSNIYCQIVDDETGKTLVAASSRDKQLREGLKYGGNKNAAEAIGKAIAERAIAAGVKQVCFDRGAYKYHGRVAAVAEAARKAGLSF
jgi:large subunit ribosomal protein L18